MSASGKGEVTRCSACGFEQHLRFETGSAGTVRVYKSPRKYGLRKTNVDFSGRRRGRGREIQVG